MFSERIRTNHNYASEDSRVLLISGFQFFPTRISFGMYSAENCAGMRAKSPVTCFPY